MRSKTEIVLHLEAIRIWFIEQSMQSSASVIDEAIEHIRRTIYTDPDFIDTRSIPRGENPNLKIGYLENKVRE